DEEVSVDEIVERLQIELLTLKRIDVTKVKIYHSDAETSDGDSVASVIRAELLELARSEDIEAFAAGEVFGPFEKEGRQLVEIDPSFRQDEDWAKSNSEVTMVAL